MSKYKLDLRLLHPRVRDYVDWGATRNTGTLRLNRRITVHVIDCALNDEAPESGHRIVVTQKRGKIRATRFSVKTFDDLMRRYNRLYHHHKLLHGRQLCVSRPAPI